MYGTILDSISDTTLFHRVSEQLGRAARYRIADDDDLLSYVSKGLVVSPWFDEHPVIKERLTRGVQGEMTYREAPSQIDPDVLQAESRIEPGQPSRFIGSNLKMRRLIVLVLSAAVSIAGCGPQSLRSVTASGSSIEPRSFSEELADPPKDIKKDRVFEAITEGKTPNSIAVIALRGAKTGCPALSDVVLFNHIRLISNILGESSANDCASLLKTTIASTDTVAIFDRAFQKLSTSDRQAFLDETFQALRVSIFANAKEPDVDFRSAFDAYGRLVDKLSFTDHVATYFLLKHLSKGEELPPSIDDETLCGAVRNLYGHFPTLSQSDQRLLARELIKMYW
ncbi:hypothetical protein [Burkholderia sp. 567]|uniref:hypothetical protein n=1 Tax=Burkholderia sp. 567 TaxID=3156413 RepID=UPI003399C24E